MIKSNITGKIYSPDNSSVIFLTNLQQVFKYLRNGAEDDLLDILYNNTKNDCLVFVFNKSELIKDLYKKWQEHTL